jgi:hypothetical protein
LGMDAIFAITVFAVVLAVFAAELVNRTVAALLGAAELSLVMRLGPIHSHTRPLAASGVFFL